MSRRPATNGNPKTWLQTAFELRGRSEGCGPGGSSGFRPAADLQSPLSRYYGGKAKPEENIARVGSLTKPDRRAIAVTGALNHDDGHNVRSFQTVSPNSRAVISP